jgi:hypothetical protein
MHHLGKLFLRITQRLPSCASVITRTSNFGTNHLYLAAHSLFSANPANFRAVIYANQRARIIYTVIATALAAADHARLAIASQHATSGLIASRRGFIEQQSRGSVRLRVRCRSVRPES